MKRDCILTVFGHANGWWGAVWYIACRLNGPHVAHERWLSVMIEYGHANRPSRSLIKSEVYDVVPSVVLAVIA